ncbi:MAG TPA: response regulator, partial [Gammaproteobacteria bacterium]|nr:response regulator [Gammaproteobacteria bacterium]
GQLRKLEIETEAQILFRYAETASRAEDEFDPLEFDRFSHIQQLSRSLLESVSDLASIETLLQNLTRESETLLLQQSRVNTDLHEGLMRARMVQFAVLMPRMRRIVRQTCQELGKHVELRVLGAEGEIDRTVLDRIVPSLEHMLRNAIDHGIEPAKARRAAGKPEAGLVAIRTEREGSEIVIKISDDGGGLNLPAIRAKAIERGLVQEGAEITDNDVMQFILEPGFTTAQHVTQISGRGIGMDVVNNELKQLSGSLHISSTAGVGTTFTVRLPLTLSINRALLVHVGEELYAIPLTNIERIVQAGHKELEQGYQMDSPSYTLGERVYHLFHLGTVLGGTRPHSAGTRKKAPLLLARSHDHRVALQVDALLGSREIVVKSVGPQISTVRGITGATILGDGRVVLILDINALVRTGVSVANAVREAISGPLPGKLQITAMVVDDSITVRKVTSRLLERHNIQVLTAKDGVDAVALLQEHIPDVMLLDIEMPRMDGYELATHMRNEERLKHIPIIMITSRTGEKHRERAMQIGVNKYMGKPYQESELLENISALVGERIGVMH